MAESTKADTNSNSNTKSDTGPEKREFHKRSQLWVKPKAQLKQILVLVLVGVFYQAALVGVLGYFTNKSFFLIAKVYNIDPDATIVVSNSIFNNILIVLAVGVVFAALTIFVWARISHRLFGPLIPIGRHIESLCDGNYTSRVLLRKGDEWQDLAEDLNKLAAVLEGKPK